MGIISLYRIQKKCYCLGAFPVKMLLKVVETDMKKRIAPYAALCTLLILCSSCRRDTKIKYIEDPSWSKVQVKSTLVIGVSDFVPILSFRNEKNEIVGYDIDIFTELCRRLGIHPVFYPIDWTQKEKLLNTGIIDCIASGFSLTEDRKQHYRMSTPYLQNAKIIVTLASTRYQKLTDLRDRKIAIEAGTGGDEALLNTEVLKDHVIIQQYNSIGSLYTALNNGMCDAIVLDLIYSCNTLDKNPQYRIINEAIATEYYTFAFRKTDGSLVAKIESVLTEMNEDNTISEFSRKWFGSDLSILNVGL